jgi:alpha-galactosidase
MKTLSDPLFFCYKSAGRPAVRYITGSTVYEECLQNGRFFGLYWSSACQAQRENLVEHIPSKPQDIMWQRLGSFSLEIDGQLLDGFWEYLGGYLQTGSNGKKETVVELRHTIRPVTVKVITGLDGTPILSRRLEITNTGTIPAALGSVCPFRGQLWQNLLTANFGDSLHIRMPFDSGKNSEFSLGYIETCIPDTGLQGLEGNFVWEDIKTEYYVQKHPNRKTFGTPYYIIRNNLTGEVFFTALAWSGGFEMNLWFDRTRHCLSMDFGPIGAAPLRVIAPQETVSTPVVHIGPMHSEFDDSIAQWYAHLRKSVLPKRPQGKEMYTVAARVVEHPGDWILREIDIAEEMGAEAFMVDAGWYGDRFGEWTENRGDWFEGDFLPKGGLAGIRDYVRNKGMLFGLWMEPEALSTKSKLYAAHPDWRVTYDGNNTETMADESVLDFANPAAAAFIRDTIHEVIGDKKLDFFKLDSNMYITEGCRHLVDGYAENQTWRHLECLYGIFEDALKQYPDVAFENCAAGGGRNDLGMLSRFHYAAQSDWSVFPFSIRAINGMTLFLPPETLCYYHNHIMTASQMTDIDTHLRVALFCSPIFVGYGSQEADRNTLYFDKTKEYTELLKTFCRPIMSHPRVYHHTPDIGLFTPAEWCVLEYGDEEQKNGYAGLFRLGRKPESDVYRFCPRGVRPGTDYEVTLHNSENRFVCSGRELLSTGIEVRLGSTNGSELILYRALQLP